MPTLKTQGTEIFILDDTNSGNEVRKLARVTGGTGVGGEAGEIDITDLDSVAREFVTGLKDNGTVSLDLNWDPTDDSHQELEALVGGDNVEFMICGSEAETDPTYSSTFTAPSSRTTLHFTGGVRSFTKDFSTDEVWRGSVSIRVSGEITITEAA